MQTSFYAGTAGNTSPVRGDDTSSAGGGARAGDELRACGRSLLPARDGAGYSTYSDSASCEAAGKANPQGRNWQCVASAGSYDLYLWF